MAKNKISEYSSTASNNTDIAGINIAEGCAPSGINNAIRELMAQLKDQQAGTDGDGFTVGGAFTSSGGAVFSSGTTFSGSVVMSSTVTMNGNNNIGTTTSSTIFTGPVTHTSGSTLYLDAAATTSAAPPLSWSSDTNTGIYRPAADTLALVTGGSDRLKIDSAGVVNIGGVVVIGSGEATTSVSGNILRAPSGSGTNITGANLDIQAGNGTGNGGSGNIILKTADLGSSGSTANTMTQRLLVTPKGGFSFGSGSTSYGTTGQVLKSNGDAPPSWGSSIISTSSKSATGSEVEFTSIPSWAKRITIIFNGVSLSVADQMLIRIGTGGTVDATGYSSVGTRSNTAPAVVLSTIGFVIYTTAIAETVSGSMVLNLIDSTWVSNGNLAYPAATSGASFWYTSAGNKTLSGALDIVSITRAGATANFDAGTFSVLYE